MSRPGERREGCRCPCAGRRGWPLCSCSAPGWRPCSSAAPFFACIPCHFVPAAGTHCGHVSAAAAGVPSGGQSPMWRSGPAFPHSGGGHLDHPAARCGRRRPCRFPAPGCSPGPGTAAALVWAPGLIYLGISLADLLDGFVARRQHRQTELGQRLDIETDAAGLLVALLVAVSLDRLPALTLLVGLAYYLFIFGIWWRQQRHLPLVALQSRPYARIIAGFQMGVVALALLPLFNPPFTFIAAALVMTPLLVGFGRDWLVVSCRLRIDSNQRTALDHWAGLVLARFLPLVLRPASPGRRHRHPCSGRCFPSASCLAVGTEPLLSAGRHRLDGPQCSAVAHPVAELRPDPLRNGSSGVGPFRHCRHPDADRHRPAVPLVPGRGNPVSPQPGWWNPRRGTRRHDHARHIICCGLPLPAHRLARAAADSRRGPGLAGACAACPGAKRGDV
jgi:phosphatidylglycerophosphate synthase